MKTAKEFYLQKINPDNERFKNDPIHNRIIELMEEYADQFRQPLVMLSLPSDEQIIDECYPGGTGTEQHRLYCKGQVRGARWMKEKVTEAIDKLKLGNGA